MLTKRRLAPLVAEFIGTYVLASAVFAMASRTSFPFFGAAAAGLAVAVMILVVGPVSGAHLNPAVSFSLWLRGKITANRATAYMVTQMLAGLTALMMNHYLLDQTLRNSAKANWDSHVFVAEMLGSFVLGFGIATASERLYEGGRLAAAIGGSIFLGVLVASFGAAGALNPAVALGIYSWSASYAAAPFVGVVAGMFVYDLYIAAPTKTKRH